MASSRYWPLPHRLPPHDFPQYPPNYREYALRDQRRQRDGERADVGNVRVDRELPSADPVARRRQPHTPTKSLCVNSGAAGGQGSIFGHQRGNNTVSGAITVHRQPVLDRDRPDGRAGPYVATPVPTPSPSVDLKARREIRPSARARSRSRRASLPTANPGCGQSQGRFSQPHRSRGSSRPGKSSRLPRRFRRRYPSRLL